MIAKSREEREHVGSLRKLFERLRKFQLKLNPAKCTFGATSGKLLGFIVSEREFKEVTFNYFPREENQLADALATLASMFKANRETEIMHIQMSIYETPAHYFSIEEESDGRPWFHDMLEYIKNQRYPEEANENDKRTIRRMAIEFVLDGDILYRRGKDQVLLRCVDAVEVRKILEEVHEGICGTHASGFTMARQI
nr:unnamed protein product [Gossypium raimondii]